MKKVEKKTVFKIITVVLAVILFCVWVFLAVIELESVRGAGEYKEGAETKYIAHRGYSLIYFENTYQAFEAAAKNDFFYGVETDVWMTTDGVFVCCHEENPFADKSIKVTKKSYDEIRDLPLDLSTAKEKVDLSIEYRICTLSDYLKLCKSYRKVAVIEIKQKFNKEQTLALGDFVSEHINAKSVVFGSFNKKVVDYLYSEHSYLSIKLFSPVKSLGLIYAAMGYNVGINVKNINKKFIEKCHKKGVYVDSYTVDDMETAKKLSEWGIDFITTNGIPSDQA